MVGLAFDRLGPRLLMPLGAALVGLGLCLSSFSTSLLHLYFSYGVVTALGQGALGFVGHNALISFWFVRQRATAIGIASMGQGLGALVMVPATQMLISSIGWRWTYIVTGGLLLLSWCRPTRSFSAARPQDVGQFPDGEEAPAPPSVGRHDARTTRHSATGASAKRLAPFPSGASPSVI